MPSLLPLLLYASWFASSSPDFSWAGEGSVRVMVRIGPPASAARVGNERPAEVVLDFADVLKSVAPDRTPDLASLQVIRQDPASGKPMACVKYAYGRSQYDIPWRWYDDEIGYDFPEFDGNIDVTEGKITFRTLPRFGYFYDCVGDWKSGHLAFIHREDGQVAWYGLYFNLLAPHTAPETVEPRGWVGDGLNRCEPTGNSTTGLVHSRLDVFDWDADGRLDLIVGCSRGGMVWYPNRGSAKEPRYTFSKLVKTSDGKPVDAGWSDAPHVVDWDGDGLPNILVGSEWNRLLLYRNRGKIGAPALEYAGLVRTDDGKPLILPWEPCPETQAVFTISRDYYPVLETVDWDGDGDLDLLAGGYVTGRIFLYENLATAGQEPRLHFKGPLEADGQVLDVGWAAAPTVADLDNDGDLDLISGTMPMTPGGGDSSSSEHFLRYYRNDGTRQQPRLHEIPFPRRGQFPSAALGTPRLADWNGDGLLDLTTSAGNQIWIHPNIGTAKEPLFDADRSALPSQWGSAYLSANQLFDWNGDGLLDAVNAPTVALNTGRGNPGVFEKPFSVLARGEVKSHMVGIGDDWRHPRLYDLDGDGRVDYMDADHPGHFWWHANRGTQKEPQFEHDGVLLKLTNGQPVHVGEGLVDFEALQGARPTYAVADFNGDGRPDLIAVDCVGIVRYFEQAPRPSMGDPPQFNPGIELGRLQIRGEPYVADWNGDGKLDVLAASQAIDVVVFLGRGPGTSPPFEPARRLALPAAPFGAGEPIIVADFDHDGDPDILLSTAYGYSCFYEHTFVESGYVHAKAMEAQQRSTSHH